MSGEDRSISTADALSRWFQTFQSDLQIDGENLHCLTSNSNLQDIWQRLIKHCHPIDHVKKVKETLRISELKERHPDRWEQHQTAQLQQNQIEQRISQRLREISIARVEQSTNLCNELTRIETMIDDEHTLTSSLQKQCQIYRQLVDYFNDLYQMKEQFHSFLSSHPIDITQMIHSKTLTKEKFNLNDFFAGINSLTQQRINQLSQIERDEGTLPILDSYEDTLTKANFDFTKQFVHLSNIRQECSKLRERLEESKREVLSRRASHEQRQLMAILDAMIASKSVDVHLNFLKKKVQTESEQTNKSDEKVLPRIHQQIQDKRNELQQLDQQLNQIIQENPLEKLEKLELKIRDYLRLLNELGKELHTLHCKHLSLSNDLHSNLFTWPIERFSQVNFSIPSSSSSSSHQPLIPMPSQTPTTPLNSLKQLLGIRTRDSTVSLSTEMPFKEQSENWDVPLNEMEIFSTKYPIISAVDWDSLARVDEQMEGALDQCQQDFHQYEEFFQNLIKEVQVLQNESTLKPTFPS